MDIKTFLNNLRYLSRYNLKEMNNQIEMPNFNIDLYKYKIAEALKDLKLPKIKNAKETIEAIINEKASICRFGDGEFFLVEGESIPFQTANKKLSERLKEILVSKQDNIFIGIGYFYYYPDVNLLSFVKNYISAFTQDKGEFINSLIDFDKQYYDTACSQLYMTYQKYDFKNYFKDIQKIWEDRDVTIICGKTVFKNIKTNIFACAKSSEYMYAPAMNAFDEYEEILERAKQINKDRLVIIILGPTATVLAYDLAQKGYQALDIGHIAKSYDAYLKNTGHNYKTMCKFFAPD